MKTIIANKNVVKKVAPREGKTIQIGNARLTWKAMGVDTAYGSSLYEMDLAPGAGIPVHSHPYAEVFYVISGYVDFLRYDQDEIEEWVRCGPGDTMNRSQRAARIPQSHGQSEPLPQCLGLLP